MGSGNEGYLHLSGCFHSRHTFPELYGMNLVEQIIHGTHQLYMTHTYEDGKHKRQNRVSY